MARVADISNINDIHLYLEELQSIRHRYVIAIAVKDTPGFHLSAEIAAAIRGLGIETDLHGKHGNGYIALVAYGDALIDRLSGPAGTVAEKCETGNVRIDLKSSIYQQENVAKIVINGRDYAVNSRGLNVVVYDADSMQLVDSVCFDTHLPAYPFYRLEDRRDMQLASVERQINEVKRGLQRLSKDLERHFNRYEVDAARTEMMLWHAMPERPHDLARIKRSFFESLPSAQGVIRKMQMANLVLLLEFDRVAKEHGIEWFLICGNLLGAVRNKEFIPWDDDTDICVMRDQLPKIREAFKDNPNFYLDEFFSVRDEGATNMNCVYQIHFMERNTPYSLDIFILDYSETLDDSLINRTREVHRQMGDAAREVCKRIHGPGKKPERHVEEEYRKVFEDHYEMIRPAYGNPYSRNFVVWGVDNVPSWTGMNTFFPADWIFPLGEIEIAGHRLPAPAQPEKVVTRIYNEPWSVPADIFSHQHFNITQERERILDGILEKYSDLLGDLYDLEAINGYRLG